jgi:hypothetical protein
MRNVAEDDIDMYQTGAMQQRNATIPVGTQSLNQDESTMKNSSENQ